MPSTASKAVIGITSIGGATSAAGYVENRGHRISGLNVDPLGDLDLVVDLNAEIPNTALDLRMPEPMEKRVARVPKALRRVRSRPFLRGELG